MKDEDKTVYVNDGYKQKRTTDIPDRNVISANKGKLIEALKRGWDTFQKVGMWFTIAIVVGIYIGIIASKTYYTDKIDDCIKVQGMVHKEKVYSISPK